MKKQINTVQLLGDQGTGTSSLLLRLADNIYTESFIGTIGVAFKPVSLEEDRKARVYDIVHNQRFGSGTYSTCRNPDMYMVSVDVTNPKSLDSAKKWMNEIKQYHPDSPIVMVATKVNSRDANPEIVKQLKTLCQEKKLLDPVMTDAKDSIGMAQVCELIKNPIKNPKIIELEQYVANRESEKKDSGSEYNSIWARLFTPDASASIKISAANKAIQILNGEQGIIMSSKEMAALK
ncbi:Rho GTPase (Miro-like) [Legionella santicrucis]|uniref:Rho GTPase (Miro-like) n=1 Tax=Legionella santicrucis TaxID=45074 RepID=A0A0W0Z663_9GAMM|nr:hypothetical protein [Legionella santicrucis]KTD64593.1 Rho GTPase (Miro-like) [Legionella santicrucis]